MTERKEIQHRLAQVATQANPVTEKVINLLHQQNLKGVISAEQVALLSTEFQLTPVQLALACLPIAACFALVPVSNFYVGAVAIGESGAFYFGANQEFAGVGMQQTVHAEQSAVMHAWLAGEKALSDMVVNYTPCGHCRQFMNELNTAEKLHIHLPHAQHNPLHGYLPDAFGPKDLDIHHVLFDPQDHALQGGNDALERAAVEAANQAYAPYSQAYSGVALMVEGEIITGRYAENAAFNPSFLPLQSALNFYRLQGYVGRRIERVVLAEKRAVLSHQAMAEDLARSYLALPLERLEL
ncbi:cytidine deaminase [Pasteurellaceae bacterium Macca]|nr:cytidine deaminase [Pasteurellaceae bacterium Macca]